MAGAHSSTIPGVKIENYNYATLYEGTLDKLLAAGLGLHARLFADGTNTKRDKRGRVCRTCEGLVDGRKVATRWLRERGKYHVYIHRTPEERERFDREEAERQRQSNHREFVGCQLTDPRGFRGMAADWLKGGLIGVMHAFNIVDDPDTPFSFDAATVEKATEHVRALMVLQERGKLTPKVGALVQGDVEFQRFMSSAVSEPKEGRGA